MHHKSYGSGLTAVNEVCKRIVYLPFYSYFLALLVLKYTVCDVDLPNPGKFPYPGFLQGFIHNLIPGLPYLGIFPYPGNFLILSIFQYAMFFLLFQ